jgi:hypothetical protein
MSKRMLPVNRLLFPEPVAAGMNPYVLMDLAYMYRSTNEHDKPIKVRDERNGYYSIIDGRHRVVASMMAGRKTVLAKVEA